MKTYSGSCHCGAIRFRFKSEPITSGFRCNCSICIRKGIVLSKYIAPADFEPLSAEESLAVYQFGDKDVRHCFCKTCGIAPFTVVASVPPDYQGSTRPGDRRVNSAASTSSTHSRSRSPSSTADRSDRSTRHACPDPRRTPSLQPGQSARAHRLLEAAA